ncbi:C40 family peptidase [Luteolibacter sp. AS25]|uniref:C40 family peptidase n=1 Tax=Luteolibacter sp. AS25 TaxID=3135776 RepID=UPI00398B1D70
MFPKSLSALILLFCGLSAAPAENQQPAILESSELRDFEKLEEPRRKLIEIAIETSREMQGMPYLFGGNGPKEGGFDCSGAINYILRKIDLSPPRTSSAQFEWVRDNSSLHLVSKDATNVDHASFAHLKPGDLVFWSGTYMPTDGRKLGITHVAVFMGYEKKDGRAVMINATNGRSYRGKKGNGFGVYDFRVPGSKSKSRLIGYGTPPGLIKK